VSLSDASHSELEQMQSPLFERGGIVLPDQHLSPPEHTAITQFFGKTRSAANRILILTGAVSSLPEISGAARFLYGVGGFHQHEENQFGPWPCAQRIGTCAVRLAEYKSTPRRRPKRQKK